MPDNFAESEGPNAMDSINIQKRMMVALPDGYDPFQLKAEYPTASYDSFHRALVSEHARPLSMPYNLAACDSSTYSFASGKLDMLAYIAALDVERQDCNDDVMDRLFEQWFREWTIINDRSFTPHHQWDWPEHPIIDAVADAQAEDMHLKNGTRTLRQSYSDAGLDLEDELPIMAEDYFGDSSEENIQKMRQILLQTHYPIAAQMAAAEQQAAQGGMPPGGAPDGSAPSPNGAPPAGGASDQSLQQMISQMFSASDSSQSSAA